MTTDEMVRRMVGRDLSALFPKQDAEVGETVLKVERLTREGVFFDVSLRGPRAARSSRWPGSSAPAAARSRARSSASTRPTPATSRSPASSSAGGRPLAAMRAGLGFVPEDRRQQGLVMDLSIARNVVAHAPARARSQPA